MKGPSGEKRRVFSYQQEDPDSGEMRWVTIDQDDIDEAERCHTGDKDRRRLNRWLKRGLRSLWHKKPPVPDILERIRWADDQGYIEEHAHALKWLREAADLGNSEYQALLGSMYFNGDGVPENIAEAVKWWGQAADQGHAEAQDCLDTLSSYYFDHLTIRTGYSASPPPWPLPGEEGYDEYLRSGTMTIRTQRVIGPDDPATVSEAQKQLRDAANGSSPSVALAAAAASMKRTANSHA